MQEQLLIIGNGFDLQCGLKSSYRDFFEDYFSKLFEEKTAKHVWETLKFYIENKVEADLYYLKQEYEFFRFLSDNCWISLFYDIYESSIIVFDEWIDIEKTIYKTLSTNTLTNTFKIKDERAAFVAMQEAKHKIENLLSNKKLNASNLEEIKDISKEALDIINRFEYIDYNSVKDNLIRLEKEFVKYLNTIIDKNYKKRVDRSIKKILIDTTGVYINDQGENIPYPYQILSFNYTDYIKTSENLKKLNNQHEKRVCNIHGNITDGNIIFGIDGTDNMDKPYYMFTICNFSLKLVYIHKI